MSDDTPIKRGYFPPNTFTNLVLNWYSEQLHAMEEPSLWKSTDDEELAEQRHVHFYRFLYLRTFDHPVMVRLLLERGEANAGRGWLHVKILDGAGGYEPGKIVVNQKSLLSSEQVEEVFVHLKRLGFWEQPTTIKAMGLDGAQWVLEGLHQGRYHIVERWSPSEGDFRETALLFLELSGQDIQPIY